MARGQGGQPLDQDLWAACQASRAARRTLPAGVGLGNGGHGWHFSHPRLIPEGAISPLPVSLGT
jgi:hypothetical protein